jgi:hypothetical protein
MEKFLEIQNEMSKPLWHAPRQRIRGMQSKRRRIRNKVLKRTYGWFAFALLRMNSTPDRRWFSLEPGFVNIGPTMDLAQHPERPWDQVGIVRE